VRRICDHCRRPAKVTREQLIESAMDPELLRTHVFAEGAGCIECGGTGFKGRTAICELMDLSDRIRDMILERRPTSEIKRAARDVGMRFLRECAVTRVLDGITTLREINKVTFVECGSRCDLHPGSLPLLGGWRLKSPAADSPSWPSSR